MICLGLHFPIARWFRYILSCITVFHLLRQLYGGAQLKCKALIAGLTVLFAMTASAQPEELLVAVAANFSSTLERIAQRFERQTGHQLTLVNGATGRHYAQIVNGAPYDLFFAADAEATRLLEEEGRAVAATRVVYARGRLALWSRQAEFVDKDGQVLKEGQFRRLAIANPRLAPYGEAAVDVLNALELFDAMEERLVRGENIAQTYQFADSGNAELAFVAYSQVLEAGLSGSYWLVPANLHRPLLQEAVLLKESDAGRAFLAFIMQDEAQTLIGNNGYVSTTSADSTD